MTSMISGAALYAVLAFTATLDKPVPPTPPSTIPPAVERVQRENSITPLEIPQPGVDPVAAGLVPADLNAERKRLEKEAKDRFPNASSKLKMWPVNEVPQDLRGTVDMTLTAPPEPCTADLEGMQYLNVKAQKLCTCKSGSWGC